MKLVQDHDPLPDAAKLRCPHLALFGAAEKNVPVADSVAAFARAACQRDSSLTVEVFPGADHRIRIAEAFAPRYLATLTRWISTVHERGYQHLP
jgi:fermentation-respiration switch protein FrsA (DUF1100 family)